MEKVRVIVKQTPRGEIVTEEKEIPITPNLSANQIRNMSHKAIQKYIKKTK